MSLAAAWSERLNPIVVKEVRQGLRTRVFWIFFGLMLLACLCISLVAWATASEMGFDGGRTFFIAFYVCLAVVQFFIIPYTAYRSMAREREDETWVLLTLTGLGPRRILRGKLSSFIVQGLLYGSAAGPFLLFCYYLNGIDLPTIALCVATGAAWQLFLTSVCVCTATLAEARITRALLHFVLLGGLLWGLVSGIASVAGFVEGARNLFGDDTFWAVALGTLWALVTYAVLLFEAAAARLSLPTEHYARGPRIAFVAQVLGALALFLWGWERSGRDVEVLVAAEIFICLHIAFIGMFVASDVDGMSRRHWAGSQRLNLLKPGALRGFIMTFMVLFIVCGALTALWLGRHGTDDKQLRAMLAAPAFVVLYLAAPAALARLFDHHPSQTPVLVRVFTLGLVMLGSGVPPLVAVLLGMEPDQPFLNALNPVVGMVNLAKDEVGWEAVMLLYGVAGGFTILALSMMYARDQKPKELAPA
ncbi:MAG: ABC transporter permease [Myxococcaceae bacterium]|nr:ABC transporter permease [Myxococcaceae bacterium]